MRLNTPVEKYTLKNKEILVKRDDLMGDGKVLPPWGKMAGIDALLKNLNPKYPLIHLAVNGSWSGWALSYLCKQRGIKFIYAYAPSKTYSQFILDKAKELEAKMKEGQENIKKIRVEGVSGSNSVRVILDGEGEMQKIQISDEILKEEKSIIEDLIVAAHNNAKSQIKTKTSEEISKATGGLGIPGFKWPL